MSLADDCATNAIARALADTGAAVPTLKSIIRIAGDMLAERAGHDETARTYSPLAFKHAERASKSGAAGSRGR